MVIQTVGFIISMFVLSWLSSRLVATLLKTARYFQVREFIVAFFVVAFAASLPNLLVDVNAAMQGMPEVAFGDILGGNLVDLTLVVAVAVLFGSGSLSAESKMVQSSAIFTSAVAVLPLILAWDQKMDRLDGVILFLAFCLYSWWLFAEDDRFKKVYRGRPSVVKKSIPSLVFNLVKIVFFLGLLLITSFFIVDFAKYFSLQLGISLSLVGILIIGLGNCFPEIYFSIISARRGENWMILGNLMGSIIVCATLVLSVVTLVHPFEIKDFSPFLITRIFMIIAALLFVLMIRTGKQITKFEGLIFLSIYILFLLVQIFMPWLNTIVK